MEREARVALEAQVSELTRAGEGRAAQLVRTVAELDAEREKRAELERRVQALETRAAGDRGQERPEPTNRTGIEAEKAPEAGTATRKSEDGNPSEAADLAAEEEKRRKSYAGVTNRRGPAAKTPARASEERGRRVIIVGDSNMSRAGAMVKGRVGTDERVKVSTLRGQTVGAAMERAKGQLGDAKEDRGLVVIMGGVNDVLQGRGEGIAKQIAKGVRELRAVSEDVQIAVCTVPEVQWQGDHVERAVVAANREIWTLAKVMNFAVIDLNWDLHRAGREGAFVRDGIHFSGRLAESVGRRLAARAVAFLGGPRAFGKVD